MTIEKIENKRKQLIFRSWHRGTREMDLLLGSFAEKHVMDFNEEELAQYEHFLTNNDPDLYNWYTQRESPPANENTPVMQKFLSHQVTSSA